MKLLRALLAVGVVGTFAGVAYVRQQQPPSGGGMTFAAVGFLSTLSEDQKGRAVFPYDDRERLNWNFIPLQDKDRKPTRKGISLQEMTPKQREAAKKLLQAGTSESGYRDATTIMSLEAILRETEKGGANVRDPEWYFFTVFGDPRGQGRWGWRVEGHHLSLNFAVEAGKVVAATPAFFGANPAVVKGGSAAGKATLGDADELARALVKQLDDDQKKTAVQGMQFPEVGLQKKEPAPGAPRGLAAAKMTAEQKAALQRLLRAYTRRMPWDVELTEWSELEKAGFDKVHFAYAGGVEPGVPHSYRVQGPTFVVEFLNVQPDGSRNPANHIHSSWRKIKGDFALSE